MDNEQLKSGASPGIASRQAAHTQSSPRGPFEYDIERLTQHFPGMHAVATRLQLLTGSPIKSAVVMKDAVEKLQTLFRLPIIKHRNSEMKRIALSRRYSGLALIAGGEEPPRLHDGVTFEVNDGEPQIHVITETGVINGARLLVEFGRAIEYETENLLGRGVRHNRVYVKIDGVTQEFTRKQTALNALSAISYAYREAANSYTNPYTAYFNGISLALFLGFSMRGVLADMLVHAVDDSMMLRLCNAVAADLAGTLHDEERLAEYAKEFATLLPGDENHVVNLYHINNMAAYLADALRLRQTLNPM